MQIIRVRHQGNIFYAALVSQNTVQCLSTDFGYESHIPLQELEILQLVSPSKIIHVGNNFSEDNDTPGFSLRPPTALIGTGQAITLPDANDEFTVQGGPAAIISKPCKDISPEVANESIFGYACSFCVKNETSATEPLLATGTDTFIPLGPWIDTAPGDLRSLSIRVGKENGPVTKHNMNTMRYNPAELVSQLSQKISLLPGDVVILGCPFEPLKISHGDIISIEIGTMGILTNPIYARGA